MIRNFIHTKKAQRLLDQITVLAAGEAIVFGSAMYIPARVQIKTPTQEPWSATATPFVDWSGQETFPLADVIENWGLTRSEAPVMASTALATDPAGTATSVDDLGDEIPLKWFVRPISRRTMSWKGICKSLRRLRKRCRLFHRL